MNACAATSRFVSPEAASSATRSSVLGQVSLAAAQPDALELGACLLRPRRRAEPLEDLERPAASASAAARRCLARRRSRPCTSSVQPRSKGSFAACDRVELVERGERSLDVTFGGEYERARARERHVDPEAREVAPARLEALERRASLARARRAR